MSPLRTSPKPRKRKVSDHAGKRFCTHCDRAKSESEFYVNRRSKDGLDAWCKPCRRAMQLEQAEPEQRRSAVDLLDAANATPLERRLVMQCVEELRRTEQVHLRRLAEPYHGTNYRNAYAGLSPCERVLSSAGIGWRRQVALLGCAGTMAREAGISFSYTRNGAFAKRARSGDAA